jgi:hypothetical protein
MLCQELETHQAALPNMDILLDPLHWLYSLHSLCRFDQTLNLDALQTIVPSQAYGYRRQAACGILAVCFTCIPTEKLWNPTIPGGCTDLGKFYYGLQIPIIVTDAAILVMPMHTVWGLPISRAQKTGLSIIFVLGFL